MWQRVTRVVRGPSTPPHGRPTVERWPSFCRKQDGIRSFLFQPLGANHDSLRKMRVKTKPPHILPMGSPLLSCPIEIHPKSTTSGLFPQMAPRPTVSLTFLELRLTRNGHRTGKPFTSSVAPSSALHQPMLLQFTGTMSILSSRYCLLSMSKLGFPNLRSSIFTGKTVFRSLAFCTIQKVLGRAHDTRLSSGRTAVPKVRWPSVSHHGPCI